jgi:hypothetical protein
VAIKFQLASELFFCDSSFFSSKERRCDSITSEVPSACLFVGVTNDKPRKICLQGKLGCLYVIIIWLVYLKTPSIVRTVLRHTTRETIINRQNNLGLVQGNNPVSVRRHCSNRLEVCQERCESSGPELNLRCHDYEAGASKTRRRYSVFIYY